jgi:hypothetical protein
VGRGVVWRLKNLDVRKERLQRRGICIRRGDTSTPVSSSDLVMTDMQTSVTGTARNRFKTVWLERFMM